MAPNKPIIERGIISFSYNYEGPRQKVDKKVLRKYARECKKAQNCRSLVMYRCTDDSLPDGTSYELLKFLAPLKHAPLMVYALMNAYKSPLKQVAVVGGDDVKKVFDAFINFYNIEPGKLVFAHEGYDKFSLGNSFWQGYKALKPGKNEMLAFIPGDLPWFADYTQYVMHPANKDHGLVMHFNSRQKMYPGHVEDPDSEFFTRKYHHQARTRGEIDDFKEPQFFGMNLDSIDWNVFKIYGGGIRKGGGIGWKTPFKLLLSKILPRDEDDGQTDAYEEIVPREFFHYRSIPRRLAKIARLFTREGLKVLRKRISHHGLEELISLGTDVPAKVLFQESPFLLWDIDSWADWAQTRETEDYAEENCYDIYPYPEIKEFQRVMPDIDVALIKHWPDIVDQHYERYGLEKAFRKGVYSLRTMGEKKLDVTCNALQDYARTVRDNAKQQQRILDAAQRHLVPIQIDINLEKKIKRLK